MLAVDPDPDPLVVLGNPDNQEWLREWQDTMVGTGTRMGPAMTVDWILATTVNATAPAP